MSINDQELETIEMTIEQAQTRIDKKKQLANLTNNVDFREIILDGYFKDEASRLVLLRADPSMESYIGQIDNQIIAVGQLRQYFTVINGLGSQAENAIEADKETREELLAEGIQ